MAHKLSEKIVVKKGTKIGMGNLKYDVEGRVIRVEQREDGSKFYGVEFIDRKGNKRLTWIG